MPTHKTDNTPKVQEPTPAKRPTGGKDRERLRDILIVFVTYPLTPTKETEEVAESKPWLEFVSLLLKVALAAYALYEGITGGG